MFSSLDGLTSDPTLDDKIDNKCVDLGYMLTFSLGGDLCRFSKCRRLSHRIKMEEFIDNLMLLVNTLGHKIFDAIISKNNIEDDIIFQISNKGLLATGKPTNEGFVVFKDSTISKSISVNTSYEALRNKLVNNGYIVEDANSAKLTKDYIFSSPSAAACIVLGVSANGLTAWKCKGKTLKELQR